jgi:4-amino-4-deoxy-L-arabinose transferase-like glycosyltransferase
MSNKPENYSIWYYNMVIAAVSALLFIPFLGGVHLFDWDEINFAESAREMIASGDYLTVQINFIPFWEKPPLFIWMQVVSMKIFGINEFAARFPNAICGIATLLVLFNTGRKLHDNRFGVIWVMLYAGSMLPFLYFKSGIIDPWFNLFIFLGIFQLYLYFEHTQHKIRYASLSGFFIGLAILTKGPVAFLIYFLTFSIFVLVKKFRIKIRNRDILIFFLFISVTGGLWFILQIIQGNFGIIADFLEYQIRLFKTQDAGHGGFLLYHFVVLLAGVFPASLLALPALFPSKYVSLKNYTFYLWMLILFWVVLILFTLVKTKIVHYSSLCYFPVTFLASWAIWHFDLSFTNLWKKITTGLVVFIGSSIGLLTIIISFIDSYKFKIIEKGWIRDPFAVESLAANGGWTRWEFLAGLIMIIGITGFAITSYRRLNMDAIRNLAVSVAVFMFVTLMLIVPRVETYSQKAAVEFFKSVSNQDSYLITLGYKSYAHLFYGKIRDHSGNIKSYEKHWLLSGDIDKIVYVSSKINFRENIMNDYPELELLYEKHGFVFFKREPKLK